MLSLQVLDSELLAYFLQRDIKYKNDVYADQSQTCDYHYSTGEFSSLEIVQEVCKEDEQVTDEHEQDLIDELKLADSLDLEYTSDVEVSHVDQGAYQEELDLKMWLLN